MYVSSQSYEGYVWHLVGDSPTIWIWETLSRESANHRSFFCLLLLGQKKLSLK